MEYKKCKRGHLRTPENVNPRGNCRICEVQRTQRWREDNPEVYRASKVCSDHKYHGAHRKSVSAYHRAYYKTHKRNPEYNVWLTMKQRCTNPNSTSYKGYGALGVRVCRLWQTYDGFIGSIGLRPSSKHSLSRFGDVGNYSPSNCIWGDRKHQAEQKRIKRARKNL